jgi:transposase
MIAELSKGLGVSEVARNLSVAPSTVSKARCRYLRLGKAGLLDGRGENGDRKIDEAFLLRLMDVLEHAPTDFKWTRTTWTRELLALQLADDGFPRVAACTMGRALAIIGARLGRPKAIVGCPWPAAKRERRLAEIRRIAASDCSEEPVFYQDEVDIHLNPKIGPDWMLRGQQRLVITPGKNEKRYIAGAMRAGSRAMTWVDGTSKASDLFCQLMWRILATHTHARRIHLILDNSIIHSSKKTKKFLEQFGDRVVLHFLPPYCPDANLIERRWLDLHANVTRNHRCKTMVALMESVHMYLIERNELERSRSRSRRAA